MEIVIRRSEPGDYEAIRAVYSGLNAIRGTLQLPYPSVEQWRKRLAEPGEGMFSLVACVLARSEYIPSLTHRAAGTSVSWAWACATTGRGKA
jgi:hypothetical protein